MAQRIRSTGQLLLNGDWDGLALNRWALLVEAANERESSEIV